MNNYLDTDNVYSFLDDNKYYTENDAPKIENTRIDFSNREDANKVKTMIANRIYKVRNAIVHSKEYEETKYYPSDEEIIRDEVPLVEFVAREILNGYGIKDVIN